MYEQYNVFEVYEPFTNSNNYTYSLGETLEVVKVKDNTYVLTTDSIFADIREREHKSIELSEEEINKKLLFIC